MQILLALIIGAALGFGVHLLVPGRESRGTALAPIAGALVGAVAWLVLTWVGLGIDNPWIWVATIIAPPLIVAPALLVLTRLRDQHDARERVRLRIG